MGDGTAFEQMSRRFSWTGKPEGVSDARWREVRKPVCVISERFLAQYGLKFRRPPECQECKVEEINFVKIALRYSNMLTKDIAFSGYRRIVAQLGAL